MDENKKEVQFFYIVNSDDMKQQQLEKHLEKNRLSLEERESFLTRIARVFKDTSEHPDSEARISLQYENFMEITKAFLTFKQEILTYSFDPICRSEQKELTFLTDKDLLAVIETEAKEVRDFIDTSVFLCEKYALPDKTLSNICESISEIVEESKKHLEKELKLVDEIVLYSQRKSGFSDSNIRQFIDEVIDLNRKDLDSYEKRLSFLSNISTSLQNKDSSKSWKFDSPNKNKPNKVKCKISKGELDNLRYLESVSLEQLKKEEYLAVMSKIIKKSFLEEVFENESKVYGSSALFLDPFYKKELFATFIILFEKKGLIGLHHLAKQRLLSMKNNFEKGALNNEIDKFENELQQLFSDNDQQKLLKIVITLLEETWEALKKEANPVEEIREIKEENTIVEEFKREKIENSNGNELSYHDVLLNNAIKVKSINTAFKNFNKLFQYLTTAAGMFNESLRRAIHKNKEYLQIPKVIVADFEGLVKSYEDGEYVIFDDTISGMLTLRNKLYHLLFSQDGCLEKTVLDSFCLDNKCFYQIYDKKIIQNIFLENLMKVLLDDYFNVHYNLESMWQKITPLMTKKQREGIEVQISRQVKELEYKRNKVSSLATDPVYIRMKQQLQKYFVSCEKIITNEKFYQSYKEKLSHISKLIESFNTLTRHCLGVTPYLYLSLQKVILNIWTQASAQNFSSEEKEELCKKKEFLQKIKNSDNNSLFDISYELSNVSHPEVLFEMGKQLKERLKIGKFTSVISDSIQAQVDICFIRAFTHSNFLIFFRKLVLDNNSQEITNIISLIKNYRTTNEINYLGNYEETLQQLSFVSKVIDTCLLVGIHATIKKIVFDRYALQGNNAVCKEISIDILNSLLIEELDKKNLEEIINWFLIASKYNVSKSKVNLNILDVIGAAIDKGMIDSTQAVDFFKILHKSLYTTGIESARRHSHLFTKESSFMYYSSSRKTIEELRGAMSKILFPQWEGQKNLLQKKL